MRMRRSTAGDGDVREGVGDKEVRDRENGSAEDGGTEPEPGFFGGVGRPRRSGRGPLLGRRALTRCRRRKSDICGVVGSGVMEEEVGG